MNLAAGLPSWPIPPPLVSSFDLCSTTVTITAPPGAEAGLDNNSIIALALGIPGLIIAIFTLYIAYRHYKKDDQEQPPLRGGLAAAGVEMENISTLPATQERAVTAPQLPAVEQTCIHCGQHVVSALVMGGNEESHVDITPDSPPLEDCEHR